MTYPTTGIAVSTAMIAGGGGGKGGAGTAGTGGGGGFHPGRTARGMSGTSGGCGGGGGNVAVDVDILLMGKNLFLDFLLNVISSL